jgi:predicted nuclease with RNAse H fold
MRSLGVDVSVRRGLDLVLLDGSPQPAFTRSGVEPDAIAGHLRELRPDVVAIDSPPSWGVAGRSRGAERELRRLGIQSYGTPSDPRRGDHGFYAWMKAGFRTFAGSAAAGYSRYRTGDVRGTALEVFPHATSVVLAASLPPAAVPKHVWRASVLRDHAVDPRLLDSRDLIDAGLAALTGLYALRGDFTALGDPTEGVIIVPAQSLPSSPYRRCLRPPAPRAQLTLPGLSPCACGDEACRAMTSREFAPGHDAKRKSLLWERARRGEEAASELRRRRWALPPELR